MRLLDPKRVPRQAELCGTERALHAQWAAHELGKGGDHWGWCLSIQRAISHYLLTQCPTCTCCHNSVCFNRIRKIALLLPKSISWRCCLHNIQGQSQSAELCWLWRRCNDSCLGGTGPPSQCWDKRNWATPWEWFIGFLSRGVGETSISREAAPIIGSN